MRNRNYIVVDTAADDTGPLAILPLMVQAMTETYEVPWYA